MEYEVIEKEERLQFLEEMFESTELKVTESYSYPTIMEDLSNVVLYHIKEVTFEGEEKSPRREAFENVIGMIQNEGVNFIYLILGDKKGVSFYFGLVRESKYDGELPMPIDEMGNNLLKSAIRGNFRGSKIEEVSPEEMIEIFDRMQTNSENKNLTRKYANITGTPGINESEDKKSFQGVDRLVDVMQGDNFGLCIIAKPLSKRAIKKIEDDLYYIHNRLSGLSKISYQEGKNRSEGTSTTKGTNESKSEGTNKSVTIGSSETSGTTENKTVGSTTGTNESRTVTEGENKSMTEGTSSSSSSNEGWNEGGGETSGGNSNSSNTTWGKSKSVTKDNGKNESTTKGTSSSTATSVGTNSSENFSKSEGTNKSTGTNESRSKGKNESITIGTSISEGDNITTGSSENISKDIFNKKAADYVKYIDEMLLPIIDYGKSKGLYLTTTFIFADKKSQLEKLGNTIKSLYSGNKGNKNPLDVEILDESDKKIKYFKNFQIPECVSYDDENALTLKSHFIENNNISLGNWYSPNELGLIAGLPDKEVVGLALNEEVEFGLNAKTPDKGEELISLGKLVQSGNEIDVEVSLEKSALNKHIFITGVT